MSALLRAMRWLGRLLRGRVVQFVGGPARARVVFLFGCVLALNSAQISTVGAVAPQLERSLHIGNTEIGLLNSVALLIGAAAVIPVGMLVDRIRRIPVLAASIVLWSITSLLGAFAGSYESLLLTRIGLGAVAATAGPAIASLTGDYFPVRERVVVYGYILGGEIAGTAVGFIVSGTIAGVLSWRWAFFILAVPGFWLARELWKTLPEPERAVIAARYIPEQGEPATFVELGRQLGMHPDKVSDIERRALRRLADHDVLAALREAA
jgi:Arabinose efflux permease